MNFEPVRTAQPPVRLLPTPVEPPASTPVTRRTPARKNPRAAVSITPATVGRVLEQAAEIEAMDEGERALVAAVLGVRDDVPDLIAAALSGAKSTGQHAVDLLAVMGADPAEAGVIAMQAGRARMRAMWRLAHRLGLIGQDVPASDAKAAIALAKAVQDGRGRDRLAEVVRGLGLAR